MRIEFFSHEFAQALPTTKLISEFISILIDNKYVIK